MQLRFEKAETKDAQALAKICERAFHSDVEHGAPGRASGPPGYNMESLHPEVKRWTLGTPQWNTRTPCFYQKCGYAQIDRDHHGDYLFEKKT